MKWHLAEHLLEGEQFFSLSLTCSESSFMPDFQNKHIDCMFFLLLFSRASLEQEAFQAFQ